MSENKHTPEPWRTDEECGFPQDIHDSKGNLFLRCGSDFDNEIYGEANARRIVACVNACAGCATEVLETAPVGFFNSTYGHPKYLEEITKQRDELLAALTFARQGYQAASENGEPDEVEWAEMYLRSIDVAIASVKENSDGH